MSRNQENLPLPHAADSRMETKNNEHRTFLLNLSEKIANANLTRDTAMAPITLTTEDQRGVLWAACLVEDNNVKLQVTERIATADDIDSILAQLKETNEAEWRRVIVEIHALVEAEKTDANK